MWVKFSSIALIAVFWAGNVQSGHISQRILSTRHETEACAQVSSEWTAQQAANATARVVVDGQLAYDCLNSVPLNAENAVRLVRSLQPFLEWQTSEFEPGLDSVESF